MTSEGEDFESEEYEVQDLTEVLETLRKANKTITNLLRREPIMYLEVAQNAVIRSLENEKFAAELDAKMQRDKLNAIRGFIQETKTGDPIETLLLVSKIETILGEGI